MGWIDEVVKSAAPGASKVIYWTGELEFMGASENDQLGRTVKFRVVRPPEEQGQVNPFAKATRKRKGFAGTHFELSLVSVLDANQFCDTVVMLNWSDGPKGATATFKLADGDEEHPFMFCKRASAESRGSRWMAVFVELDDGQLAVNQQHAKVIEQIEKISGITEAHVGSSPIANSEDANPHPYSKPGLSYAQNVGMMLKAPRFHDFLTEMVDANKQWDFKTADAWLKATLCIESKTELNQPGPARSGWERIRGQYLEFAELPSRG